jgi:hypothetical protein
MSFRGILYETQIKEYDTVSNATAAARHLTAGFARATVTRTVKPA